MAQQIPKDRLLHMFPLVLFDSTISGISVDELRPNRLLSQVQVGQAQSTVLSIFTISYAMAAPWWRALEGHWIPR